MLKGNLLIVDDEPLIVKNLKLNLAEHADQIFTAMDGVEALKVIDEQKIDCIICDINMPKMNGVEVIKRIRAANNQVPFIFYTAHGNDQLMLEAAKYGAFDFLNKPNLEGLEEVIARGLDEGINRGKGNVPDENAYISEYTKLLKQLEEEDK